MSDALLGLILIGMIAGTTTAATTLFMGMGFLFALMSYAAAGSAAMLMLAMAHQVRALARTEAAPARRTANA